MLAGSRGNPRFPRAFMNPPRFRTPPVEYTDMTLGLIAFGALTTVLGAVVFLFGVLLLLAAKPMAQSSGMPVNWGQTFSNTVVFSGMGATLMLLGFGSIRRRRWARILMGIVSWTWLICAGLIVGVLFAFLKDIAGALGAVSSNGANQHMAVTMIHVQLFRMLVVITPVLLGIPLVWVWFYSSRSVRLTCESADAGGGWTDRCPPSVLTVSLGLALSVPFLILGALTHHGMMPFFGIQLSGFLGGLVAFLLAGVWAYCAWAVYSLRSDGWWITTVSFVLVFLSSWLTWRSGNLDAIFASSGLPADQLEKIRPMLQSLQPMLLWTLLLFQVPIFGSMLWIRGHFFNRDSQR